MLCLWMNILFIAPIPYFNSESNVTIENIKIVKGSDISLSQNFKDHIGICEFQSVCSHQVFYFEGEYHSEPGESLNSVLDRILNLCVGVTFARWFVKDNSSYTKDHYIQNLDTKEFIKRSKFGHVMPSNDNVQFTNFNISELSFGVSMMEPLFEYCTVNKEELEHMETLKSSDLVTPLITNYVQHKHIRIKRAMVIFNFMRLSNDLMVKIMYFMSIYECLFCSSKDRIGATVKMRVSKFAGEEDLANVEKYSKLIDNGYEIRSRLVHGDNMSPTRDKFISICTQLDDLTRIILNKIILMSKDDSNNVFVLPESPTGKADFEAYWNQFAPLPKVSVCNECKQVIR